MLISVHLSADAGTLLVLCMCVLKCQQEGHAGVSVGGHRASLG